MSKFSSATTRVDRPSAEISDKFDDLTKLQSLIDQLPEAERAKLGDVEFTKTAILVKTAQVGAIKFEVVDRTPELVKFKAAGSPIDVALLVDLKPVSEAATDLKVDIEMEIPMMLRPMIAPHMQKAVDMLGAVIANVASR